MGVIRMIKMFGWENKMSQLIDEKREVELTWLWWSKIYGLCTMNFQFRIPVTELLDEFYEDAQGSLVDIDNNSDDVGFRSATFSWAQQESNVALTPSKRRYRLHIDDELLFKRGCINLIVGSTGQWRLLCLVSQTEATSGSGKTSLLMALLGEMHFLPSGPRAWFNLPRAGGVAYAAQESWVMNATIKVRPVILEEVLAALDVHTAKWIVDKCFVGDLIQGRTVLLVTHNVSMVAPISKFVVSLGSDGQILSQGTILDALAKNSELQLEVALEKVAEQKAEEEIDGQEAEETRKEAQGKLILEEESGEGHISWESGEWCLILKMYLVALGGRHWIFFWTAFTTATFFECAIEVLQPWLLGVWATQYTLHPAEDVNIAFYLMSYVGLVVLMLVVFCAAQATLTLGAIRASTFLHKKLIEAILGTTLRQDVSAVDTTIPDLFSHVFELGVILIVDFLAIMFYTPVVGLFGLVIVAVGACVGDVYMKSQLAVKREMSKAKAPVMAHFGASIEGITSIRAYGAQESVLLKSLAKVDDYSRASRVFNDLARWIAVRVEALGGIFAAVLGAYFVYGPDTGISTSNSAFTLTLAVVFGRIVLNFVQILNMFEVNGNSLERLLEYIVIEQEPKPNALGVPPAHWPSSGALRVEKLSARYALDGPRVLHNLSFTLNSGERIGVVGRTGSGKSSLTLALLRCIPTQGNVWYDGLDTAELNLESVRGGVTIIPQVPELLSGTLRRNLDPFDQFDDAVLNGALRDAGLFALQGTDDESRLTLDSAIARGGNNLSVGQRQIVALARAMVRDSKVLILDEATSAIDYKTDAVIQASLRTQLAKDVTVITVAHRLQTIMDSDRIMVLDAGNIVEFDAPSALLQKSQSEGEGKGYLRALVDESGDREALYSAAGL
ncbi:hypothetical protein DXG03_007917 [Asterophora parasitica]|uniref:ABC transporter n=1 Tax=Asterophora parasitica TaxID=117018 RepID=A0A9P7G6D6_9AGAR|nr:hypothetical protein DXG03_007917 [Asterophora parasitica]